MTWSTTREMPKGPLSVEVEFKARPSNPLVPSPSKEGTIGLEIRPPIYAQEQHDTWRSLFSRQAVLLQGRVCEEYIDGRQKLQLPADRVPHLSYASAMLQRQSGWQAVRVDGYVPEKIFFTILSRRAFPCTDFVRHPTELEYTPAPDMFHDLMGHLPMITHPRFARFFHEYGQAGTRAQTDEQITQLGRIYWFTVEFGIINPTAHHGTRRDPTQSRIYGAGISSSFGEIMHCLSNAVEKRPFDIDEIAARTFDIHNMQPLVYEIESFDELEHSFKSWTRKVGLAN